jgi:ribosomal protein S6--L-glutamate ligase
MILSYHPIIETDRNILCAGRTPDTTDRTAIRQAEAVILPQGCPEALYRMARTHCPRVFPNLDVRFDHPGKRGQIQLFEQLGIAHPRTRSYPSVAAFEQAHAPIDYPAVIKLDWGGQGDTVFKVEHDEDLERIMRQVVASEACGQSGFLIQRYVPCGHISLRVVVIGQRLISYWRRQETPGRFGTSVAGGASIDHDADPERQAAARSVAADFCRRTGLQLAGFDFIFDADDQRSGPLMLEINYYFGRSGLGGSEAFYRILAEEVDTWLAGLGLNRTPQARRRSCE